MRVVALLVALVLVPCAADFPRASADDEPARDDATTAEYKKLKNPVRHTKESIVRGRIVYRRHCTECHGKDGKALVDLVARGSDLTVPKFWIYGSTEGEIFGAIRDGVGDAMPPYEDEISDEKDLWHMVNFIRSLWPPKKRPPLEPSDGDDSPPGDSPQASEGSEKSKGNKS